MSNGAKRTRTEKMLEEAKRLGAIVTYLWIILTVFQLHRGLILAEHKIPYSYGRGLLFALINAWVLGKFVLLGESFSKRHGWSKTPLFSLILYRSAICGITLVGCNILEGILSTMWRARSLRAGLPALSQVMFLDNVLIAVMAIVVLIPLFAARELSRVLGKFKFYSLLFRTNANIGME
jgi:hypothetical protein